MKTRKVTPKLTSPAERVLLERLKVKLKYDPDDKVEAQRDQVFSIHLDYLIPTTLTGLKWQQKHYPTYDELQQKVREHALKTGTDLQFFEVNAVLIIEENIFGSPHYQEVQSVRFGEHEQDARGIYLLLIKNEKIIKSDL